MRGSFSLGGTYLPQRRWFCHTIGISSIGTPLVLDKYLKMKKLIINTQTAKKMNFKWHNIRVKTCATPKVKIILTETLILWVAEWTSSGKISLGTNHPRGPHDHKKPATYTQMKNTNPYAYHDGNSPRFSLIPNLAAIAIVISHN